MSLELLYNLNGEKRGAFYNWLNCQNQEPRIAWYPSAGNDYRDLLYLSDQYSRKNPAGISEPPSPTFFIHTDYGAFFNKKLRSGIKLYEDVRTVVQLKRIEELPRCDIALADGIVDQFKNNILAGRVVFMEIDVQSKALGHLKAPVLYAFCENEAFCSNVLLPLRAKISHIVQVRYGAGMGSGGRAAGIWLWNVMGRLGCQVYVGDGDRRRQSGDLIAYQRYPNLRGTEHQVLDIEIRRLYTHCIGNSDCSLNWRMPWGGFDEVRWYVKGQSKAPETFNEIEL
jgi:hypothetical protein